MSSHLSVFSLLKVSMDDAAGILGSYLATEGRVSDVVSGAFKVIELQGKTDSISTDFRKVQHAVLALETKINRIEGKLVLWIQLMMECGGCVTMPRDWKIAEPQNVFRHVLNFSCKHYWQTISYVLFHRIFHCFV
ncbi:uncharacterized protein LOC112199570 [Rosa chinensis]|uniref:uncharacterized protein LOC112199570 n=1 Tax=Rosa chinensis TaxID=74649 RepID=UPI000D08C53C|nr:uncharacterized protein LOC112199570 [Rosa chinensis]